MNASRYYAACTLFEGKIVVTGGCFYSYSVEAYDYYENKWTYLPHMIESRNSHASVSMGNKLFVVGGEHTSSCEVFDSFSRKFTLIEAKLPKYEFCWLNKCKAVSIGNTIIVIGENNKKEGLKKTTLYIYDVQNNV